MNDEKEQAEMQRSESNSQSCCDGGSCCPSGSDGMSQRCKMVVFIIIVLAAGIVLARSIIKKSDSAADQTKGTFAAVVPEAAAGIADDATTQQSSETGADTQPIANEKAGQAIANKALPDLWGPELDSLVSLSSAAANSDAVFIFLAADDGELNQTATEQIEAAARIVGSSGVRISAFRLSRGAPNYANFSKQLSTPCVLAMVKGGSISGVSADQITESKLVQAYVTASRPSSGCCPPGSGVTCK